MSLKIKLESDKAKTPSRGSEGAAGYDLSAYLPTGKFLVQLPRNVQVQQDIKMGAQEIHETGVLMEFIPAGARALIPTGVQLAIPNNMYGRVAPRSGLAWKNGIDVMAGVIDSDFRGGVGVILVNLSAVSFPVRHGDRIAQLIFERIETPNLELIEGELSASVRGADGYGSTGSSSSQ